MAKTPTPKRFNEAFIARIREMREAAEISRADMAKALDVEYEAYKKYETRSPLPHHLIERFAIITGANVEYLMTGSGPKLAPLRRRA